MKKILLAILVLFQFAFHELHAQCTIGTNLAQCGPQTYARSTMQTFKSTCSGLLKSIIAPNVYNNSDDLRGSGYYVVARIRAADGTIFGTSAKTDQWYPGTTVTFDMLCTNAYLVAGTTYQIEFFETSNTFELYLFCSTTNNAYPDGNLVMDGVPSTGNDLNRWQVVIQPDGIASSTSSQTQDVTTCGRFANTSGELMAFVSPGTTNPISGSTTAKVWIESVQPATYVRRHVEITPASSAATATGKVTLYFTQADFDAFNAVNAIKLPANPTDASGKANLLIEKRSGVSNNGTGSPNSYPGTPVTINPADADIVWNAAAARWEVKFDVAGFSGFFVKTSLVVLPMKWISFTAQAIDAGMISLKWNVQEEDAVRYEIQRSTDGIVYNTIAVVSSKGAGLNQYEERMIGGGGYYRVRQIGVDGSITYSQVQRINQEFQVIRITPTVFTQGFYIHSSSDQDVQLIDGTGKVIRAIHVLKGSSYVDGGNLSVGLYLVKGNGFVEKVIKQ